MSKGSKGGIHVASLNSDKVFVVYVVNVSLQVWIQTFLKLTKCLLLWTCKLTSANLNVAVVVKF